MKEKQRSGGDGGGGELGDLFDRAVGACSAECAEEEVSGVSTADGGGASGIATLAVL